jgi:hypothetical protein
VICKSDGRTQRKRKRRNNEKATVVETRMNYSDTNPIDTDEKWKNSSS